MSIIQTEALVLKTTAFQDSSMIVRLFTLDQGKISVIAKGARRMKSSFRGYLEPLNHLELIYYYKPTREIQTLSKVELLKRFLDRDAELLETTYSLAVLELIDRLSQDHHADEAIFTLILTALSAIDEHRDRTQNIFAAFLIRLIETLGYKLNLRQCSLCHRPLQGAVYESNLGRISCTRCADELAENWFLNPSIVQHLQELEQNDWEAIISLPLTPPTAIPIQFLIQYLGYHLDFPLHLKSLDMLQQFQLDSSTSAEHRPSS